MSQLFLFSSTLVIILITFVFLAGFTIFVAYLMWRILANIGGWPRFAERFPGPAEPTGHVQTGQTVRIGAVRYRFCVTIGVSDQGLYLAAKLLVPWMSHQPMLIPWSEFKSASKSILYWRSGVQLSICEPSIGHITLYRSFYDQIQPYLTQLGRLD